MTSGNGEQKKILLDKSGLSEEEFFSLVKKMQGTKFEIVSSVLPDIHGNELWGLSNRVRKKR